jgi:hypothetical protein
MVVATNAGDSDAAQVWKALKRVGLGEYFKGVFTSRELGGLKPELRFFRQLESVLARAPHQLIMIGDSYRADMLGAKNAGWKAVWYNPGWEAAPALLPFHDAEVQDLRNLPLALNRLHLPDVPTSLAWLVERGTPHNILAHVQLVAAASYLLSVWLGQAGADVDPILTHRGGLLHDLAKIDSLQKTYDHKQHDDHGAMASTLLMERNQPELAEIASRHIVYTDPAYPRGPRTWEEKLVHFTDKLAEGARLVSIDERLLALKDRYPAAAQELEQSRPILEALQAEICGLLHLSPTDLLENLRKSLNKT